MLVALVVVLVYVVVVVVSSSSSSSSSSSPPPSSSNSSKIVMVIIVIVVLEVAVVEVVAVTERKPCTTKIQKTPLSVFPPGEWGFCLGGLLSVGFCPTEFVLCRFRPIVMGAIVRTQ